MKKIIAVCLLIQGPLLLLAGEPVAGFTTGRSPKFFNNDLKRVDNNQDWNETRYEYQPITSLYGERPNRTELKFWKKRLYSISFLLPMESLEMVKQQLTAKYGKPWYVDSSRADRWTGNWGTDNDAVAVYQSPGYGIDITFSDASQKKFHSADLLQGLYLYLILTIVGLFVIYYLIGYLFTSYCKKCHSFKMRFETVSVGLAKDYSTTLFQPSMHRDTVHQFKCKKCGHIRKYHYSGFWNYMRSKKN